MTRAEWNQLWRITVVIVVAAFIIVEIAIAAAHRSAQRRAAADAAQIALLLLDDSVVETRPEKPAPEAAALPASGTSNPVPDSLPVPSKSDKQILPAEVAPSSSTDYVSSAVPSPSGSFFRPYSSPSVSTGGPVYVHSYVRKDGTVVSAHTRRR